jgi:hypothetical protein
MRRLTLPTTSEFPFDNDNNDPKRSLECVFKQTAAARFTGTHERMPGGMRPAAANMES